MNSTINKVKELSAGISEAKIYLKLVKQNPYIHIYNFKIIISVKYLANMIPGKNVVTELTTRISETKTNPKFAKKLLNSCIFSSNP